MSGAGGRLVVGVGAGRGVAADVVVGLIERTLGAAALDPADVVALATADVKAAEPGIVAAADRFAVPLLVFPVRRLADITVPHPSPAVHAALGTPSVAEAAALAAAPGGRLLVPKHASPAAHPAPRATVAVARRA